MLQNDIQHAGIEKKVIFQNFTVVAKRIGTFFWRSNWPKMYPGGIIPCWGHQGCSFYPLAILHELKSTPKYTKKNFFFNFWSVEPSKVCIYVKNHMLYETRGQGASLGKNFGPKKWGINSLYQFLSEHSRSCRSYQMQFFWRLLYSNQAPHLPKHFDIW